MISGSATTSRPVKRVRSGKKSRTSSVPSATSVVSAEGETRASTLPPSSYFQAMSLPTLMAQAKTTATPAAITVPTTSLTLTARMVLERAARFL